MTPADQGLAVAIVFGLVVFAAVHVVALYRSGRRLGEPPFDKWDLPRLRAALSRIDAEAKAEDRRIGEDRNSWWIQCLYERDRAIRIELARRANPRKE